MPGRGHSNKRDLDDIQVLGDWNFNIQTETPLVWLRSGALDRYLLRFTVDSHFPSTAGLIFHAEADGPGFDGVSFWIERRPGVDGEHGYRRYVLSGDGLESKPVTTRRYPDAGGQVREDVEVLVQGYTACIFVRDRMVQIKMRTKIGRGSICFYNSTKATEDGLNQDISFSGVRITALRRGPLEVAGTLRRREALLKEATAEPEPSGLLDSIPDGSLVLEEDSDDKATTAPATESSLRFSKSGAGTTGNTFYQTASPSGAKGVSLDRSASSPGFTGTTTLPLSYQKKLGGYRVQASPGNSGSQPTRLQRNLSDSALRKSGGLLCGLSSTSKAKPNARSQSTAQAQRFGGQRSGGTWAPYATNGHTSEQQFVREQVIRPLPQSQANACQDFIPM
jgi:hypothetical protein